MFRTTRTAAALVAACTLSAVAVSAIASAGSTTRSTLRIHSGWLGTATRAAAAAPSPTRMSSTGGGATIRGVFITRTTLVNTGDSGGFAEFAVSGPVRAGGARIGFGIVRCALTAAAQGLADCTGVFNFGGRFPNGSQLTIQGLTSDATDWFNAITGGTGRFARARGQVEARNIGTTNRIAVAFHVTR